MLTELLRITEMLLGRTDRIRLAEAERRKRLSIYFENVSRCLSDISIKLQEGNRPHQACSELETYAREYSSSGVEEENVVARVYGEEIADDLHRILSDAVLDRGTAIYHLCNLKYQINSSLIDPDFPQIDRQQAEKELAQAIENLANAAGRFKALSVMAATSDP